MHCYYYRISSLDILKMQNGNVFIVFSLKIEYVSTLLFEFTKDTALAYIYSKLWKAPCTVQYSICASVVQYYNCPISSYCITVIEKLFSLISYVSLALAFSSMVISIQIPYCWCKWWVFNRIQTENQYAEQYDSYWLNSNSNWTSNTNPIIFRNQQLSSLIATFNQFI